MISRTVALVLVVLLFGCASTTQYIAMPNGPAATGMARIKFVRHSNFVGGGGLVYLIDLGTNIDKAGSVVLNDRSAYKTLNYGLYGNGTVYLDSKPGSVLFNTCDSSVTFSAGPAGSKQSIEFYCNFFGRPLLVARDGINVTPFGDPLVRNGAPTNWTGLPVGYVKTPTAVVGAVASGDTLVWDRRPGVMRLEVVTITGLRSFAKDIMVESGKTYNLAYSFADEEVETSGP